jgi:hypothetical protein
MLLDHGTGVGQGHGRLVSAPGEFARIGDRPAVEPGAPRVGQCGRDSLRRLHEVVHRPRGRSQCAARVLGGRGLLPQHGDLVGGVRGPCRVEHLARPADRARLVAGVPGAVGQCLLKEGGTLQGVLGAGRPYVLDVGEGEAQPLHRRPDLPRVGSPRVERGAQLRDEAVVGCRQAGHQRLKGLEVRPSLDVDGQQRPDGAVVLQRVQGFLQLRHLGVRRLTASLSCFSCCWSLVSAAPRWPSPRMVATASYIWDGLPLSMRSRST